jgi:hypothetical protein
MNGIVEHSQHFRNRSRDPGSCGGCPYRREGGRQTVRYGVAAVLASRVLESGTDAGVWMLHGCKQASMLFERRRCNQMWGI